MDSVIFAQGSFIHSLNTHSLRAYYVSHTMAVKVSMREAVEKDGNRQSH